MRESAKLKAVQREWVGQRVRYYVYDALKRVVTFDGPFTGIVRGATNNGSQVEDRAEGLTHRNSVSFTGELIIEPDDGSPEETAWLGKCEKI
jgi:hypothetical protein